MIRFSSSPVPFAARQYVLPAGHVMTGAQLAQLVRQNAEPRDVAIVCADRPTLIAATKAFRSAMGIDKRPAPVARTEAPDWARAEVERLGSTASPEAKRWVRMAVASAAPLSPDEAQDLADEQEALVMARGCAVLLQGEIDRLKAQLALLTAQRDDARSEVAELTGRVEELLTALDQATAPKAKRARTPRAKAPKAEAPRECISDDGLSTY